MSSFLDALFERLLKYPLWVFDRGTLVWQGIGGAPVLVPLVLLVAGVAVVSYANVRSSRPWTDRLLLGFLRLGVFALLATCLLRPTLLVSTSVPDRNVLAILLDDSQSMRIKDVDSLTRRAWVGRLVRDSTGDWLRRLEQRFVLRFYRFADGASGLDGPPDSLAAAGARTDLGAALDQVRRDLTGSPVAGMVVLTDGADNGTTPMADALLALKASRTPVYTVGVGAERFMRDVAIDHAETPLSTLKGATMVASVGVRQRGFAAKSATLTVEDGDRIVAAQQVTLGRDDEVVSVPVRIPPLEAGSRHLRFTIKPMAGEAIEQNNVAETSVTVRDRREKILYLEGELRPEFTFLRRAAAQDSNLQLVGLLRTADGKFLRLGVDDSLELIRGFPTTRAELFRYRALVLGNVEAAFFTGDQLRMIADFVSERGGSLLTLGGRRTFGEGGYAGTPVADVLPLSLENRSVPDSLVPVELAIHPTPAGLVHAALQLGANDERNRARWDSLPPLTMVNELGDLKPGATLLLEGVGISTKQTRPVLAVQRYGRGRGLILGVQDSWLWQMHASISVEDQTHETFWRQTLRALVEEVPDRLEVTTAPSQPAPGQRVAIQAELADSSYLHVNDAVLEAHIVSPSGKENVAPLEWALGREGVYTGAFVPEEIGAYRVEVVSRGRTDSLRAEPRVAMVADRGVDFLNAEMRAPLLRRIAAETGGRFYTPASVGKLPDDVMYTKSGVTVTERKDLWDMPAIFLGILLLLGLEWGYRRSRGMV